MRIKQLSGRAGEVMKTMPSLNHEIPNSENNYKASEVMKWMAGQPEIMQWLISKAISTGKIVRDGDTGKWKGTGHP